MWLSPKIFGPCLLIFTITSIRGVIVKQENSLYGPFEGGAPNLAHWELIGSAQLGQTYLRLTPDETNRQGGIWNTYPVASSDWELHMQFHIHGKGIHNNGNGMGIWYVKEYLQQGHVFGSRDHFNGLGIFIDTVEDLLYPHKHRHPYISAVVSNGSQPYEHNEDGTVHQVGGCHMPIRNLEWPTKIAVSYIASVLTVYLDVEGKNEWAQCFRSEGVYLPTQYYFGITASTGHAYADNHDVIFITALDMNLPEKQPLDLSFIDPYAENVLIHPKPDEIQKTIEQLQQFDEELQKFEEKRELKEEPKQTEQLKIKPKEAEKPKSTPKEFKKSKGEETSSQKASLLTKCIYVVGVLVILYIGYSLIKIYLTQRRERIQKRLY